MIDLHVHTTYSDGEKTPLEILDMCHLMGITHLAICDHNIMDGAKEACLHNPYPDITVIPGVELSAKAPQKGATLHILGLGVDVKNKALCDITDTIRNSNSTRFKYGIDLLFEVYGLRFELCDVQEVLSRKGNIGRPEMAKLCLKYGYVQDIEMAFKKYLNPIRDELDKIRVSYEGEECIKYILEAGGIPCIAHPVELQMNMPDTRDYILRLKRHGLQAIEVYHSKQSEEYSQNIMKMAKELGLLYSVGSDYHGPNVSPDVELGLGCNHNLGKMSASVLTKL